MLAISSEHFQSMAVGELLIAVLSRNHEIKDLLATFNQNLQSKAMR